MKQQSKKLTITAYGAVVSGNFSINDEQAAKDSKAYRRLLEIQELYSSERYNFNVEIAFDVLNTWSRKRKALEEVANGSSKIIVIDMLSVLGTKKEELLANYKELHDREIGLVILKEKQFSTVKYDKNFGGFRSAIAYDNNFERLCDKLSGFEYQTNRGKKKLQVTKEFEAIYWLYENYLIDTIIYKNRLMSISRTTFRNLCDEYEKTDRYREILLLQKEKNKIDQKPKRSGSIDETTFEQIYCLINSGSSLSEACEAMSQDELSDLEYERYLLKYTGKKSATLKAAFEYKDDILIKLLSPDDNTSLDVLNRLIRDALGIDFMLSSD